MAAQVGIVTAVFLAVSGLLLAGLWLLWGRRTPLDARLERLSGKDPGDSGDSIAELVTDAALPALGAPLIPPDPEKRTRLQSRLIQAGFYSRKALHCLLGVKMLLLLSPWVIGLWAGAVGLVRLPYGVAAGGLLSTVGMVGPGLWLARRKARRQAHFRGVQPDFFDMLVLCLEGGLGLGGALVRVGTELRTAHPRLAAELDIVQAETHLGLSVGEALHHLADRLDLEEVRGLAALVSQTERLGGGLARALRAEADALRQQRVQRLEELARQAGVKVLFLTLFFIFPGILTILVGPAGFQLVELVSKIKR